jgi:hypothetical protein
MQFNKSFYKDWRVISVIFILLYVFLLVFSYKNGPVIAGDSIQYLSMSFDISQFRIPYSDKWLQLYPSLISVFNLFFDNLILSAFATNIFILSFFILFVNKFFNEYYNDFKKILLVDLILLSDRELYFQLWRSYYFGFL